MFHAYFLDILIEFPIVLLNFKAQFYFYSLRSLLRQSEGEKKEIYGPFTN